jgi:hypothetical protein
VTQPFRRRVEAAIRAMRPAIPIYNDLLDEFQQVLRSLHQQGIVTLGDDAFLASGGLELRVEESLRAMRLGVRERSRSLEDRVVYPPSGMEPSVPAVVEVKSSKYTSPSRDDLRQLDDWVFELSGEEVARKESLYGTRIDFLQQSSEMVPYGVSGVRAHPSPHKGVLIFNGPLGVPFDQRPDSWLHPDQQAFAEKRNFCVVSLPCLLAWHEQVTSEPHRISEFWKKVIETAGVLASP